MFSGAMVHQFGVYTCASSVCTLTPIRSMALYEFVAVAIAVVVVGVAAAGGAGGAVALWCCGAGGAV
eukprot:2421964-Amphidinium_carterae.1